MRTTWPRDRIRRSWPLFLAVAVGAVLSFEPAMGASPSLLVPPEREILEHDPAIRIGPLLKERFHQGPPYNTLCPIGCLGLRCPAGCTSVAAAQVAHFHAWQMETGNGPAVLHWDGDPCCVPPAPGGTLVADLSDLYAWEVMPDSCGGGCGAPADSALAELVHEVGVALSTRYGTCGSSSVLSGIGYALETYLGYAPGWETVQRTEVASAEAWSRVLREELCLGRPLPYGFHYTTGDAHDAVCDGWGLENGVEWFHLNLGQGDAGYWFRVDQTGISDPNSDLVVRRLTPPGRHASVSADGAGDYPTIQAALDALPSGSVIELVEGIYRGPGNVELDPRGKAITLRSANGDPSTCILDGGGAATDPRRIVRARTAPDRPFVLDGVTLRGGIAGRYPSDERAGGGAILGSGDGLLLVLRCRFESNRAEMGGAIEVRGRCRLLAEACVFVKNEATHAGGAVMVAGAAEGHLRECTFYGNGAKTGSGVALSPAAGVSLRRCIVASGRDGAALALASGDQAELHCCDLWGNDGGDWTQPILVQLGVEGNLSVDPAFCAAERGDLTLRADSPCALAECGRMGALDSACGGDLFLVGQGQPYPDLASALAAASGGGRILLTDSLYTGDGNRDLHLECPYPGSISIEAADAGAASCVFDLQGNDADRHRWMSVANTWDLSLRGITVRHGHQAVGGALSMEGRRLTLDRCDFEDCVAPGTADGLGGALYVELFSLSLRDCRFSGCAASQGGAVRAASAESLLVERCRFEANTAAHRGGALWLSHVNAVLRETVLAGNEAAYGGALALLNGSRVEASNSTFAGNRGSIMGAVAYITGVVECERCILANNTGRPLFECAGGYGRVTCCDLWENDPGSYGVPCLLGEESQNLELDPLFCAEDDLHLQPGSPCLPDQPGNEGCGWIGALPVECRADAGVPMPQSPSGPRLSVGANPSREPVEISWTIPVAAAGPDWSLRLFDAGGRLVREFAVEGSTTGAGQVRWDGHDREGRRAPAGAYFAVLSSPSARARVRWILMR